MKVKKWINFAVYGLMLVVLVTVAALAAIMASTQQNINSSIQVTYKPVEVNGTASAKYYKGASDKTGTALVEGSSSTDGNSSDNVLTFKDNVSSPADGFELNQSGDVVLSETDNYVVYEYKFTNSGSNAYVVDFASSLTEHTNVKMSTFVSETEMLSLARWKSVDDISLTFIVPPKMENADGSCYAYIKFEVNNPELESKVNGKFTIGLDGRSAKLKELYEISGTKVTGLSSKATNLCNLVFPNDITEISATFDTDKISSMHIGKNITKISDGAFTKLTSASLQEITIDSLEVFETLTSYSEPTGLMKVKQNRDFKIRVLNSVVSAASNSYFSNVNNFLSTSGTPYNTYTFISNGSTLVGEVTEAV